MKGGIWMKHVMEMLWVSAKLGITSFGGPIAHLGYFHEEYVRRRKWLDEKEYADLVALCQFLPGPASSQVGIGIGLMRGGYLGAIAAWIGFTLPSVLLLVLFATLLQDQGAGLALAPWLHGLKLTAVAIVAQAVWSMGQKLSAGRSRMTITVCTTGLLLLWPGPYSQIIVILAAGFAGLLLYTTTVSNDKQEEQFERSSRSKFITGKAGAIIALTLFFGVLLLLPLVIYMSGLRPDHPNGLSSLAVMFDSFYRAGALVFGGGHVVLPLLQNEFVASGWISESDFLAGYGAAQAVPGPLFTFASYLGAQMNGMIGVIVGTLAIFLPGFLLVTGVIPYWDMLRNNSKIRAALQGINAAVVGILLAALYDPIWTSSVQSGADFVIVLLLFSLLAVWKLPAWCIVLIGAALGFLAG